MAVNFLEKYTGELGPLEDKISGLTGTIKQSYANLPAITQALRTSLAERDKNLGGFEAEADKKIRELYDVDREYASRYANPESSMYIENPMKRQEISSGQKGDIRKQLGDVYSSMTTVQNKMGSALEKGMEIYKAGLQAQEFELSALGDQWSRSMEKGKFNYSIAQDSAKSGSAASTKSAQAAASKLAAELANGLYKEYAENPTQATEAYIKRFGNADLFWGVYQGYTEDTTNRSIDIANKYLENQMGKNVVDELEEYQASSQLKSMKEANQDTGTNSELLKKASDAQMAIDSAESNGANKSQVYNRIISDNPDLFGYIHP